MQKLHESETSESGDNYEQDVQQLQDNTVIPPDTIMPVHVGSTTETECSQDEAWNEDDWEVISESTEDDNADTVDVEDSDVSAEETRNNIR